MGIVRGRPPGCLQHHNVAQPHALSFGLLNDGIHRRVRRLQQPVQQECSMLIDQRAQPFGHCEDQMAILDPRVQHLLDPLHPGLTVDLGAGQAKLALTAKRYHVLLQAVWTQIQGMSLGGITTL